MQTTLNHQIYVSYSRRVFGRAVLAAGAHALHALAALLLTWQRRSRQRAALAALSDRMLADIGISRLDALHEAGKPFWTR